MKPTFFDQEFSSFDAYDAFLATGTREVEIHKTDNSPFSCRISQLTMSDFSLSRSITDAPLIREGQSRSGGWMFGFSRGHEKAMHWCGTESRSNTEIGLFPNEYHALIRSRVRAYAFHVSETYIERFADLEEYRSTPRLSDQPRGVPISLSKVNADRLEKMANGLLENTCQSSLERLQYDISALLINSLTEAGARPRPKIDTRRRAYDRARSYIHANARKPLLISEITRETAMSARTLAYAFKEHAGMAPMSYLKVYRLNRLRDELRRASTASVTVSDLANGWGFWHMGKLASDYRRLFGVTPSVDLCAMRTREVNW